MACKPFQGSRRGTYWAWLCISRIHSRCMVWPQGKTVMSFIESNKYCTRHKPHVKQSTNCKLPLWWNINWYNGETPRDKHAIWAQIRLNRTQYMDLITNSSWRCHCRWSFFSSRHEVLEKTPLCHFNGNHYVSFGKTKNKHDENDL
jgi:hypothetical protein